MSPIVNLQLVVKCKKCIFHSFRGKVALLRYIVFSFESGCDTSEPHVSYISRACSSLVRQPYYAPNCIISKIRGLETILASEKGRLDGRTFYIDEYTLIFLFSQCIMCAQKRYCWERRCPPTNLRSDRWCPHHPGRAGAEGLSPKTEKNILPVGCVCSSHPLLQNRMDQSHSFQYHSL